MLPSGRCGVSGWSLFLRSILQLQPYLLCVWGTSVGQTRHDRNECEQHFSKLLDTTTQQHTPKPNEIKCKTKHLCAPFYAIRSARMAKVHMYMKGCNKPERRQNRIVSVCFCLQSLSNASLELRKVKPLNCKARPFRVIVLTNLFICRQSTKIYTIGYHSIVDV